MEFVDIKNHKTSISQTHNLEVPGSSPGWSTNKRLILNRIEPLLIFGLRHTSPVFV
jgi:hypothetical protein